MQLPHDDMHALCTTREASSATLFDTFTQFACDVTARHATIRSLSRDAD